MPDPLHAFDYLSDPDKHPAEPVCVVFGDESFLRRLVLEKLEAAIFPEGDDAADVLDGKTAQWRDVHDELSTVSLFGGGRRVVVIAAADEFVTRYRPELEDYAARPASTGILVLEVESFLPNTKLYKKTAAEHLLIDCRPPLRSAGKKKVLDERRLIEWMIAWCGAHHDAKLERAAAELLVELRGTDLGLLDQELAKLALFVGRGGKITALMVREIAGGWRARTAWDMIDAAADGNASEALLQLDRLIRSGEHPLALFGQISWSLRRFAVATRIYERAERQGRRMPLTAALEQAGFRKWPKGALEKATSQLRQLGRRRAAGLYQRLLEVDLSLKGSHSAEDRARFVLERLLVGMAEELKVK